MNDECRIANDESNPKSEFQMRNPGEGCHHSVIRASSFFRHSSFGFRHSPTPHLGLHDFVNDILYAEHRLLKNPGFTAVAVLALALRASQQSRYAPQPFAKPPSGIGLACLGIEQTDSGNLSGVNQVPMNSHPNHEEFGARFRRDSEIFGISNRQRLAVGEVQLESAKRSSVAHFLEVRDFHVCDPILNRSIGIIN